MMKRLSLAVSTQTGTAPSEFSESVADTSASVGSKSKLSLGGVMLSRRFAKRLSSIKDRKAIGSSQMIHEKEPTYRMEPTHRFNSAAVEKAIRDVIDRKLANVTYDAKKCALLTRIMSEEIKERVKMMGYDRYKTVCVTVICQRQQQEAICSSRCSWDKNNDSYATYTYKNPNLICNCTVYGIYRE